MESRRLFVAPGGAGRAGMGARRRTWGGGFGGRLGGLLAGVAMLAGACGPSAAVAAAPPRAVVRATEIPQLWEPGQHLYVKGNLGVGAVQLDALEAWLRAQATNWTVVLVEQAQDERFTDASGASFTGMDAVEHALGKGLPNQTAFGQFADPRTGERNGAFFVLFLEERKFSYFGSDAQDRRGLGEDRWAGQLDQPAIAAMRGGGRIVDAVKDTIANIDGQLAQRIAAERAQREQREAASRAERERALVQARASLETATATLNQFELRLGVFTADFPRLSGDLARPPLPEWRANLEAAGTALAGGNPSAARALADTVNQRAVAALRGLEDYRQAGAEFDALSRQIESAAGHPQAAAVKAEIDAARAALAAARQAHERGDVQYGEQLATARRQSQVVDASLDAAARAAQLRRQAVMGGAGAGGLGVVALGVVLNRRRRSSRREALDLVAAWSTALDEKTLALFKLLERTYGVVGSSAAEARNRYAGATLALSEQVVRDVDELTIMSACASRILAEAKALALPGSVPARATNLFLGGRYRAAIRRLRDEPIAFRPEEGLGRVMRGARTERDHLLGSLESYQPFQFSFTELIAAFNQRAERALSALGELESALIDIGGKLKSIEETTAAARAMEARIDAVSDAGGFRVAPVFGELLPAAQQALSEAAQVSIRDAVGALAGPAAVAERAASDAMALAELALEYRQRQRPRLQTAAKTLTAVGLQSAWLSETEEGLSTRADRLAVDAVSGSAATGIAALRADGVALVERAERIVTLEGLWRDEGQHSIDEAQAAVAAARAELARTLGKVPGEILREPELDPSERLALAQEQMLAVKAALERGDASAAQNGLAEVERLRGEAVGLVEATRQAYGAHAQELALRVSTTERLQGELPGHERILVDLAAGYAPSVLELGQGDPTHPNANNTVRDNLEEAREHLEACRGLTERSVEAMRDAQVLESASCLRQVAARQEQAAFRLQEIVEKQQRIRDTEAANDALVELLNSRVSDLESSVADARTMRPTVAAFESERQQLAAAARLRAATPRDPFAVAAQLTAVREAFERVADQVRSNRDSHADAGRSLEAAAGEIEVARRLQREAGSDAVPDSPGIVEAGAALEALSTARAGVEGRFREAHGDWLAVDVEANRIAQEAGRLAATLRGELAAAEQAVATLDAAANRVRAAGAWTGGLGVWIQGSPGSDSLEQARRLLASGSYQEARRLAETARQAADLAVAQAEAEMLRRRRAEEERRERERRAREAAERARRNSIGIPGLRGSGVGRSGFAAGSGVRRSTFSGGSGVARSGW